MKKKKDKIMNITVTGSTENVYHVKRQNLHSVYTPYNKNKNSKWQLRSGLMIKRFHSEMIFFRLDWEKNTYGQKHFRETNNFEN